jgi:hypothetical protein
MTAVDLRDLEQWAQRQQARLDEKKTSAREAITTSHQVLATIEATEPDLQHGSHLLKIEAGLRVCPGCGKPLHMSATVCRSCGEPVSKL